MTTDLRTLARRLGGEVTGRQVVCPGPGHSRSDRSLAVRPEGGRLIVFSHCGDDWRLCRDYVRERLGLPTDGRRTGPRAPPRAPRAPSPRDRWQVIWRDARHPRGTPVEAYLGSRGLTLPDDAAGEALRFHPACPFGRTRTPAMVALIRDIHTDEPCGIHRTALDPEGRKRAIDKCDRRTLGRLAGGVVKITPDDEVVYGLGIGEGIETSLSLRHVAEWQDGPVWACLSAGNLAAFPILPAIQSLHIAVDHDEAGEAAAREVIWRWHEAGRDTYAYVPRRPGADVNDLIPTGG